ncbi:MAG: hypothetical protein RR806_03140 [Oscillospiraceae bacterium]
MAFDINNFVIDRVRRGSMMSKSTGDIQWSVTQMEDPSLKCSGESKEVVDAIGAPIASFDRAKKVELSSSNALFDLNLYAAQMGTTKKVASAVEKITSPMFEIVDIVTGYADITLKHIPVGVTGGEIKAIYALNGDSSLGTKYILSATTASATEFKLSAGGKLTPPTGLKDGSQLFIPYEYETDAAVEVVNTATQFPKAGKFVMEVIGHDVCDQETVLFAYLIMPNAKLSTNVDYSFTLEGKHPFSMTCSQDYCDKNKKLFNIVIPQA